MIDKSEAAERLIVNAITMADRGDDPLAIHVVAASALNMLREMIEKCGDNYVEQTLKFGIFIAATARLKGDILSTYNAEMDALIGEVMKGIQAGEIAQAEDLTVTLSHNELREMLGYIIRPYNFLKHAGNDILAKLDENEFDPVGVITHALNAFSFVCPARELPIQVECFLTKHNLLFLR